MEFTHVVGMNERQRQIMKMAIKRPSAVFVCKELESVLSVSAKTLRADLSGLVDFGLLKAIPINRRLTGYRKTHNFEERMSEIRENKGIFPLFCRHTTPRVSCQDSSEVHQGDCRLKLDILEERVEEREIYAEIFLGDLLPHHHVILVNSRPREARSD